MSTTAYNSEATERLQDIISRGHNTTKISAYQIQYWLKKGAHPSVISERHRETYPQHVFRKLRREEELSDDNDNNNNTPEKLEKCNNLKAILRLFLMRSDFNASNSDIHGRSLLHILVTLKDTRYLQYVLENVWESPVDLNQPMAPKRIPGYSPYNISTGWTPLILACIDYNNSLVKVCMLLQCPSVDPNCICAEGKNAIQTMILNCYGGKQDYITRIRLLLDRGTNPNAIKPSTGQTALHMLASKIYYFQKYDIEATKLLIERGADIAIKDFFDLTAMDIAISKKNRHFASAAASAMKNRVIRKLGIDRDSWGSRLPHDVLETIQDIASAPL